MTKKKLSVWQTRNPLALVWSIGFVFVSFFSFFHEFIAQGCMYPQPGNGECVYYPSQYCGRDSTGQYSQQDQNNQQQRYRQRYRQQNLQDPNYQQNKMQLEAEKKRQQELQLQKQLTFLGSYWSTSRTEGYTTASQTGSNNMREVGGYVLNLSEGFVMKQPQSGAIALKTFWNPDTLDNATVASKKMQKYLLKSGYIQVMDHHVPLIEGYVFAKKKPGTVALNLYWSPKNRDYYTTIRFSKASAANEQYEFVSVEGYIYPNPLAIE